MGRAMAFFFVDQCFFGPQETGEDEWAVLVEDLVSRSTDESKNAVFCSHQDGLLSINVDEIQLVTLHLIVSNPPLVISSLFGIRRGIEFTTLFESVHFRRGFPIELALTFTHS